MLKIILKRKVVLVMVIFTKNYVYATSNNSLRSTLLEENIKNEQGIDNENIVNNEESIVMMGNTAVSLLEDYNSPHSNRYFILNNIKVGERYIISSYMADSQIYFLANSSGITTVRFSNSILYNNDNVMSYMLFATNPIIDGASMEIRLGAHTISANRIEILSNQTILIVMINERGISGNLKGVGENPEFFLRTGMLYIKLDEDSLCNMKKNESYYVIDFYVEDRYRDNIRLFDNNNGRIIGSFDDYGRYFVKFSEDSNTNNADITSNLSLRPVNVKEGVSDYSENTTIFGQQQIIGRALLPIIRIGDLFRNNDRFQTRSIDEHQIGQFATDSMQLLLGPAESTTRTGTEEEEEPETVKTGVVPISE